MARFESLNQYSEFADFVKRKARYVLAARNRHFLDAVIETSTRRKRTIERGTKLWRAQKDCLFERESIRDDDDNEIDFIETPVPHPPDRMLPLADRAWEGRVNPKGIPCLYLAVDMNTAMAEVQPWIGSYVSVATFVMLRDLNVVDCSAIGKLDARKLDLLGGFSEPTPSELEEWVWESISRAFSQPVTRADDVADYAPTRVLAEAFRSAGHDGIVYGSKLGKGNNVAVFDLGAAELSSRHVFQVESVDLKFSYKANPTFAGSGPDEDQNSEDYPPGY